MIQGQTQTKPSSNKKDLDCTSNREKLDECGLAQGFSFIFSEYSYSTNHSHLIKSCKRQSDAYKCLKHYSKCLAPLSRQVLSAITAGRIKYNRRLCTEVPTEFSAKFIETFKCMSQVSSLAKLFKRSRLNR